MGRGSEGPGGPVGKPACGQRESGFAAEIGRRAPAVGGSLTPPGAPEHELRPPHPRPALSRDGGHP